MTPKLLRAKFEKCVIFSPVTVHIVVHGCKEPSHRCEWVCAAYLKYWGVPSDFCVQTG